MNIDQAEKNLETTVVENKLNISEKFFDQFIKEIKELSAKQKIKLVNISPTLTAVLPIKEDYLADSMEIIEE